MNRYTATLSLLALLATPTFAGEADPAAAVDRYFEAYQAMDLERMIGSFTPDATFVDVAQRHRFEGEEGLRQLLGGLLALHTEMDVEVQRRVVAGNLVAVDYLSRGSLSGEALRAATGKETCRDTTYEIPVTSWFEIDNGRIRHQTDFIDLATLNEVRAKAAGAAGP